MDWHQIVGISAGVIQVSSIVPYIKDILKGRARPNIISFFLWSLLSIISILAQWSAGASWSIIILIATAFNTSLVVILCLAGYGYKKYGFTDRICFVLAVAAIILWQITKQPLVALILGVLADLIASIPTITKTYHEPFSETFWPWFMIIFAAMMAIASTTKLDIANLIYPIYFLMINSIITALIFFGQRKLKNSTSRV